MTAEDLGGNGSAQVEQIQPVFSDEVNGLGRIPLRSDQYQLHFDEQRRMFASLTVDGEQMIVPVQIVDATLTAPDELDLGRGVLYQQDLF